LSVVEGDDELRRWVSHGVTYARRCAQVARSAQVGPSAPSLVDARCCSAAKRARASSPTRRGFRGPALDVDCTTVPFVVAATVAATPTPDYVTPWTRMDVRPHLTWGNVWT